MSEQKYEILRIAKELTGSSNIDIIMETAAKIMQFNPDTFNILNQLSRPNLYVESPTLGIIQSDLRSYQENSLIDVINNRKGKIIISPRQAGKTVFLAYTALVMALKQNQSIVILSRNKFTAVTILDQIKLMLSENPFRHQMLGFIEYNKTNVRFDNGSSIISASITDENILRSRSPSLVLIDEPAFFPYKYLAKFFENYHYLIQNTVIVSSPYKKEGPFYNLVVNELSGFDVEYWDNVYTEEHIAEVSKNMTKEEIDYTYRNKFIDA